MSRRITIRGTVTVRSRIRVTARITRQVRTTFSSALVPPLPVRSAALPSVPVRQIVYSAPLGSIRQAADEYATAHDLTASAEDKPYDVFVCHAFADKDDIVRPLVDALSDEGLSVWYDDFHVSIGDILSRKIDAGLIRSRFGLVVLSPAFFGQGWRQRELDGLVTMEVAKDRQIILPVWHNVTHVDVMNFSPTLASKMARSTSHYTVAQIAAEVAEVARRRD
jgi:hypothetical protein